MRPDRFGESLQLLTYSVCCLCVASRVSYDIDNILKQQQNKNQKQQVKKTEKEKKKKMMMNIDGKQELEGETVGTAMKLLRWQRRTCSLLLLICCVNISSGF